MLSFVGSLSPSLSISSSVISFPSSSLKLSISATFVHADPGASGQALTASVILTVSLVNRSIGPATVIVAMLVAGSKVQVPSLTGKYSYPHGIKSFTFTSVNVTLPWLKISISKVTSSPYLNGPMSAVVFNSAASTIGNASGS